jgi:hypothetical protein
MHYKIIVHTFTQSCFFPTVKNFVGHILSKSSVALILKTMWLESDNQQKK